ASRARCVTLERRFDTAMMRVYRGALSECKYKATRFLQMLYDYRGVETARILLRASDVSDGYVALWERGRLDLTVEAILLEDEWQPLFSDQDRETARKRLANYGYKFGAASPSERVKPPPDP